MDVRWQAKAYPTRLRLALQQLQRELTQALRPAQKADPATAAALFNQHQHDLVEAARAHAELVQWESFTAALERVTDPGTRQVLTWVRDLFGLSVVERHLAWYLVNGRLSAGRARTISPPWWRAGSPNPCPTCAPCLSSTEPKGFSCAAPLPFA